MDYNGLSVLEAALPQTYSKVEKVLSHWMPVIPQHPLFTNPNPGAKKKEEMMTKTNFFKTAVFTTVLCVFCINLAHAKKRRDDVPRGTSAQELAKLKAQPLPQPSSLKVAVLPLFDTAGLAENTRIATATVWMLLQQQNFKLTPILSGFAAKDNDAGIEPGTSLRQEDAIRIGKKLGVNWVVYGEVRELRITRKTGFFGGKKYADASLRLVVVEIPHTKTASSNILFWQMRHERKGGNSGIFGSGGHGDLNLKRDAALKDATAILDPFFAAFPKHKISDIKINEGEIRDFINAAWPDKDEKEDDNSKKETK